MTKINSTCMFFAMILIIACNNNNSRLTYKNDIETDYAFNSNHQSNIMATNQAHSGKFVSKIDSFAPYSSTFNMRVSEISNKPLKTVHLSAWIKMESMNSDPKLVVNVLDSNRKSLEWISKHANQEIQHIDEWTEVSFDLSLSDNHRNDPGNYLLMYVSNGRKEPSQVDDIYIVFADE